MKITVNLDVMLAKRKMTLTQLSEEVDITLANLSILKNGKAKAIRFSTLEKICEVLDCQPGDILAYDKRSEERRVGEESRDGGAQDPEQEKRKQPVIEAAQNHAVQGQLHVH